MRTITFRLLSALLLVALLLAGQNAPPAYAGNSTVNSYASSVAASSLPGVRFVHIATADNTYYHFTTLDHPLLNGNPNAIFLVTPNWNPGGATGVWYDTSQNKWTIFNQDGATMSVGASFNVLIPTPGTHVFVHTATSGNISGNSTYLNHSLLNGNPNAIVLVTQNFNPGGVGGTYNNHAIGVWYNISQSKWAIFNQDLAAMPPNASFNVVVANPASTAFVHKATSGNIAGHITYLNHPLLNGNPNAIFLVTPKWNPGGAFNDHPIGVWYTDSKWAIFNQDLANMPLNASFNVLVPDTRADVFAHKATSDNIAGHVTYLNHPLLNGNPNAIFLVTQNWNPGGAGGTPNNHAIGVYYSSTFNKWTIFNQDIAAMPPNASFNVLIPPPGANVFVHKATSGNIPSGNPHATVIDHPLLNGNPNAVFLVTQNWNPGGVGNTHNNHAIGVYYAAYKWAIFNQDLAAMPTNASFNVMVLNDLTALPWSKAAFVHTATSGNTLGNSTALNHALSNSNLLAFVFATDNYNPGGGSGVYNNHNTGVWYTGGNLFFPNRWAIFNQDLAAMPTNASFNVLVIVRQVYLPTVLR